MTIKPISYIGSFFTFLTTKKAIMLIIIAGILVFFNGISNSFVGDDEAQIIENRLVHSVRNIPSFFAGGTFYNGGAQQLVGVYYKPLLNTIFSFIYTFFGPNFLAFHFFQIILHIINVCILFLFLKHFFGKSLSLILSLIFLVHPINNESVFYISAL